MCVHYADIVDLHVHDKRRPAHSDNSAYGTYTSFCSCRAALVALFSRSVTPSIVFTSTYYSVASLTLPESLS